MKNPSLFNHHSSSSDVYSHWTHYSDAARYGTQDWVICQKNNLEIMRLIFSTCRIILSDDLHHLHNYRGDGGGRTEWAKKKQRRFSPLSFFGELPKPKHEAFLKRIISSCTRKAGPEQWGMTMESGLWRKKLRLHVLRKMATAPRDTRTRSPSSIFDWMLKSGVEVSLARKLVGCKLRAYRSSLICLCGEKTPPSLITGIHRAQL